jgi:hypothetical protein
MLSIAIQPAHSLLNSPCNPALKRHDPTHTRPYIRNKKDVMSHLYALPDDVLRAMATFMPLSSLLAIARCSRRLTTVLRGELNRRFLHSLFGKEAFPEWRAASLSWMRVEEQDCSGGHSLSSAINVYKHTSSILNHTRPVRSLKGL